MGPWVPGRFMGEADRSARLMACTSMLTVRTYWVSPTGTSGAPSLGYGPQNDGTPITAKTCGGGPSRQSHRHAWLFGECFEVAGGPKLATPHLQVGGDFGPILMARLSQCRVYAERASRCPGTWRRQRAGHLRGSGRTTGNGRPSERSVPWSATYAPPSRDQRRSPSSRPDDPFEYLLKRNHGLASCFCGRPGDWQRTIRPHRDGHTPFGVAFAVSPRRAPERRVGGAPRHSVRSPLVTFRSMPRHCCTVVVMSLLALLAGCGTAQSSPPINEAQTSTPLGAVNAWFHAINSGDEQGAKQLFADDPSQTGWVSDAPRNAFTNVDCHEVVPPAGANVDPRGASVRCTFKEAPGNWMGNPDSYWTVGLVKRPDNRWLITTYGQP